MHRLETPTPPTLGDAVARVAEATQRSVADRVDLAACELQARARLTAVIALGALIAFWGWTVVLDAALAALSTPLAAVLIGGLHVTAGLLTIAWATHRKAGP